MKTLWTYFFFNILLSGSLLANPYSNVRNKVLMINSDSVLIDSVSIVPSSVLVFDNNHQLINTSDYEINYAKGLFINKNIQADIGSVQIMYRVFSINFSQDFYNRDYDLEQFTTNEVKKADYRKANTSGTIFGNKASGIERSGNISRGITMGNSQNASVNSSFNLQLNGKLTENLNIVAAISDNNIPVQPDGYTQQLQEFDKIFIQLHNNRNYLTFGDYELHSPNGYFMKMDKKLLGADFKGRFDVSKNKQDTLFTNANLAVSNGKYNRYFLQVSEGNQGPYKLTGANNELYIIVLSGTEKVYVNGKLITRGEDQDYVIDYNLGEIIFMPNQPITKDKRVQVEFQYTDKNYTRFLTTSSVEHRTQKGTLRVNVFSEQDVKSQPLFQDLTEDDVRILNLSGDDITKAVSLNFDTAAYSSDIVLYEMVDTVQPSGVVSIFKYSTDAVRAKYRVGFSYVGYGNGDYILAQSSANGKVFEWIEPINGVSQGAYIPAKQLIAPERKQMITIGNEHQITSSTAINTEIALSNYDANTFSDIDNYNNTGYAGRLGVLQQLLPDNSTHHLDADIQYEYKQQDFTPIERYKTTEFERDWNVRSSVFNQNEHLASAGIIYRADDIGNAKYYFNALVMGEGYKGQRNLLTSQLKLKKTSVDLSASYLSTEDSIYQTSFYRHRAKVVQHFKFFNMGGESNLEHNVWAIQDTLQNNSSQFYEYIAFVENPDSSVNRFRLAYVNRNDFQAREYRFGQFSTSNDYGIKYEYLKNRNNQVTFQLHYRTLQYLQDSLSGGLPNENTLLTRLTHHLSAKKGFITSSTAYQIGGGMELRKDFIYIRTTPGQGTHKWIDYNGNTIAEQNEFVIADFKDEANYIKILNPTIQYLKVLSNELTYTFAITPRRIIKDTTWAALLVKRFENNTAFQISNKSTQNDFIENLNSFDYNIDDTSLIYHQSYIRNTFSFNKINTVWGVDYLVSQTNEKTLSSNGFNYRTLGKNGIRIRVQPFEWWNIINESELTEKNNESESFIENNYRILGQSNNTEWRFSPFSNFQINATYQYSEAINRLDEVPLFKHKAGGEIIYGLKNNGSLVVKSDYVTINFGGEINSPVAYEMLQGLLPGDNFLWIIGFQRVLPSGIEVSVNYEGRKSNKNESIHIGNVQLRAYF